MVVDLLAEFAAEIALRRSERDPVLRAPRSRQTRHDASEIKFQGLRELRLWGSRRIKQSLRLAVRLDQFHLRFISSGQAKIRERLIIDREEADGGAVLGRHVAEGCAIRN